MDISPAQPRMLHTSDAEFPLHEYHLNLGEREWTILHTGVILTHADESQFFREMMSHLPYGVALWPASIALAHELVSRGVGLRQKKVLELGAGTGLPGIVASSLGAYVVQTDRQELAMMVCESNCEANGIHGIEHRLVDWTHWHDQQRYDWIIGSDILYNEEMHFPLQEIFEANLGTAGTILLSDPYRGPSIHFLESLQECGWNITATNWKLGDEDNPRTIGVFELTRSSPDSA